MQGNLILPGRIAAKITARLATTTQSSAGKREGGRSNQNADINYDQSSKELNKQKEIFSERELDIVRLLQQGLSNREIADKLYLTVGTVKNYLSQIYLKLDVNDRANAVIRLRELEI
jgi:DNA-binding NarL/FixJ family response regulator